MLKVSDKLLEALQTDRLTFAILQKMVHRNVAVLEATENDFRSVYIICLCFQLKNYKQKKSVRQYKLPVDG